MALPELDAVKGAMLTNCVCFIPSILALLSRNKQEENRGVKLFIDVLAILAQATGLFVWPIVLSNQISHGTWAIPAGVVLTSFGWWENYVDVRSPIGFVKYLGTVRNRLKRSRYFVYSMISLWKIVVFFACMVGFLCLTSGKEDMERFPFLEHFFNFDPRSLVIQTANSTLKSPAAMRTDGSTLSLQNHVLSSDLETETIPVNTSTPLVLWTIQVGSSVLVVHYCANGPI